MDKIKFLTAVLVLAIIFASLNIVLAFGSGSDDDDGSGSGASGGTGGGSSGTGEGEGEGTSGVGEGIGDAQAGGDDDINPIDDGICRPTELCRSAPPSGGHDGGSGVQPASGCGAWGWAYDPDGGNPVQVHVYVDGLVGVGTLVNAGAASASREDVCQSQPGVPCNSGFNLPLPSQLYDNRPHQVYVYALDSAGGGSQLLVGSPKTLTCSGTPTGVTGVALPTPQPCGNCGGTLNARGECVLPGGGLDPTIDASGQPVGCNSNGCRFGGVKQCDGSCSGPTPPMPGQPCQCGGVVDCNGNCNNQIGPSCTITRSGDCLTFTSTTSTGQYQCSTLGSGSIPNGYSTCTIPRTEQCSVTVSDNCGSYTCYPDCAANARNPCAYNSCGSYGGHYACNGICSGSPPPNPPLFGQACTINACTQGRRDCNGDCIPSGGIVNPVPDNYGTNCGSCGTVGCSRRCESTGVCNPGTTQCSGSTLQRCSSACAWQNVGACPSQPPPPPPPPPPPQPLCTNINRDCRAYTQVQFELIHQNYYSRGLTNYQSAILQQIQGSNRYACPLSASDNACCPNPNSCVYNSQCYPDRYKADIDNDGIREVCIASSPGQWADDFEINCADNIDDDGDNLIDCNDTDCNGALSGFVRNQDSQPISQADVLAKEGLTTAGSAISNNAGLYNIATIKCGTFNLIASHPNYAAGIVTGVVVNPRQQASQDISMILGSLCEADCTLAADNIVHASCDGVNGCSFYDSVSRAACDNSQPGWIRDYNASHYVTCASGAPQLNVEIQSSVSCSSGTLVKMTRIVMYNGKPVRMVVAACG